MIQSIANLPLSRGNHGGRHQGRSNTSLSSRALFRCTILLPKSCEMYCLYCIPSRTSASSSFALFWRAIAFQVQLHNFFDAAISDFSLHLVALICQVLYRGTGHWVGTTCIHFFQKFYYPITQPHLPNAPDTLHLSKCYQEYIYISTRSSNELQGIHLHIIPCQGSPPARYSHVVKLTFFLINPSKARPTEKLVLPSYDLIIQYSS